MKTPNTSTTTTPDSPSVAKKMVDKVASIPGMVADTVADKSVEMAGLIAEKTFEKGSDAIMKQLNKLLAQKQDTIIVKSSLKLLMEQYLNESYIGQLTDWYGKKSWLEKFGIGSLVLGSSALIAAVSNLAITIIIVTNSLYHIAAFLLINNYDAKVKRNKQLYENLVAMEAELSQSATVLNSAIQQFATLNTTASKQNIETAEQIKTFSKTIVTAAGLNNNLLQTIKKLEQASTSLICDHEKIIALFQQTIDDLGKSCLKLNEQSTAIHSVASEVHKTNDELMARNNELIDINQQFQTHSVALTNRLSVIDTRIAEDDARSLALRAAVNKVIASSNNKDRIWAQSDESLERIKLQLEAPFNKRSESEKRATSALLAFAARAIALSEARRTTPNATSSTLGQ